MESKRWRNCIDIFDAAIERPAHERTAFLEQRCQGDEVLRGKVELLLKSHEEAGGFIESPAFEVAPELLLDEADALIGQHLGRYRIESVLGVGGMGVVYLAQDEGLGRKVGLKLLPQSLVANEAQLERLKHEARTASALNHPNIVTIHEIGEANGTHYIATEFIEGTTLREHLARGAIPPNEALDIALQIASALSVAHAAGIVHRDIKPENIMLRPDGYVKVLDFGIAKFTQPEMASVDRLATRDGIIPGTARYMSPEQARGQAVDARTDIWSLGVVLYEVAGGIPPFPGDTPSDCIASILKTEPPPLSGVLSDVPIKFRSIVERALRKNRNERYQTIKEMLVDLRDLKGELDTQGSSPRAESIVSAIQSHKQAALLTLAAVILVAAALGYSFFRGTPTAVLNQKSIAVLPFVDLSQARDQEYLCGGIQEEILTRLSKIADLKVISRTSTQPYKSAPKNLLEIANRLGVAHIVEGSVQKSADQVRVSVQLIDARNDSHVWADKFDRKLTDIFAVESEVATSIAAALQAKLTGAEQRTLSSRPTQNSEAHQAYLKGLYYWSKFSSPDFDKSRDYFQKAIDLDPSYAVAHAGLASYYHRVAANGVMPPNDAWPKCEAEVNKAIELDEALAEAYNPRAALRLYYQRDWPAAERDFRRGIELNPNWAEIRVHYALCLAFFGRNQDALAEIQHAVELDPVSTRSNMTLARILFASGQEDAALAQFRSTIELDGNYARPHEWLGYLYEKKRMHREAIAEWAKALVLSGEDEKVVILEQTYAASGFDAAVRALAQKRLEQLKDKTARAQYIPAAEYVLAYARAGDKEQALNWLAKAVEERSWFVYELRLDPRFDFFRGDARFEELLSQIFPRHSPEIKSLAVLPLENLSNEKENAFFADGVHEELLSDLAKIRELKVISRTSVMQYKSGTRPSLKEIARQLGVNHVVEGSVRRSGDQVRVSVQLIDARTDTHLWAEHYDRNVADIFAVQTEIAEKIANQLRAQLSPAEQTALAERPTADLVAYALYTKAGEIENWGDWEGWEKTLTQEVELLKKATQRDPTFALAYCALANAHEHLFSATGGDRKHLDLAKEAAESAVRVRPDSGESHLALARYYWMSWSYPDDFDRARQELAVARGKLPNNSELFMIESMIDRHQNRWDAALTNLQRASELDPNNGDIRYHLGDIYLRTRRYHELEQLLMKQAATGPSGDPWTKTFLAEAKLAQGDPVAAQSILDQVPLDFSPTSDIWETRLKATLYLRDYDAADRIMAATPAKWKDFAFPGETPESFTDKQIALAHGDKQRALAAFATARKELERTRGDKKDVSFEDAARLDAALGRKEDAIREALRGVEFVPIAKESLNGPMHVTVLAQVYAWTGERDRALDQLEIVATIPCGPTYGDLLLNPSWDDLRGDSRFDKIVAAAKAATR